MERLEVSEPELAEAFARATSEGKRNAALAGCEAAVRDTRLDGPEVELALEALRRGASPGRMELRRLKAWAEALDESYLELAEADDGSRQVEVDRLFSRARAASALVFALASRPTELHEAIYEALAAVDSSPQVKAEVARALGAGNQGEPTAC